MRRVLTVAARACPTLVAIACGTTGFPSSPATMYEGALPNVVAPDTGPDAAATTDASAARDARPPDTDAACNVRIDTPTLLPPNHVPIGTEVGYDSNPPSSGSHYPIWASFQEYATPVPDPYLVHSMEHGAVVLFYKCQGACPEIVNVLRAVRDATPTDPLCDPATRVRVIIVPRPALDDRVAAAAWGATYRAECADETSLLAFVEDHYAKSAEDFCAPGTTSF